MRAWLERPGWIWFLFWLASSATPALSQSGEFKVEPTWVHEQWTVERGLPVNSVNSVLQAKDGYLWIGSYDGLVRFDGNRFTVIRTEQVPALGSNRILGVTETKDGLWIRADPGFLARYRDGEFERMAPALGAHASAPLFVRDASNTLWIGGSDRVFRAGPDGLQALGFTLPEGVRLRRFAFDSNGVLWLCTTRGVASFTDGRFTWVLEDSSIVAVLADRDRLIFFRRDGAPLVYDDQEWGPLEDAFAPGLQIYGSSVVLPTSWGEHFLLNSGRLLAIQDGSAAPLETVFDGSEPTVSAAPGPLGPDGERWWAIGHRIFRNHESVLELQTGTEIRSLAIDHEGTIWATTHNAGLHSLRPAVIGTVGQPEGLPSANIYAVYEDRAERLWIGTHGGGLWHLSEGRLTEVPRRRTTKSNAKSYPRAMVEDEQGTMWVGLLGGLFRVEDGELVSSTELGQPVITDWVNALLIDRHQRLWVGTIAGLYCRQIREGETSPSWHQVDSGLLPHENVRTLAEDSAGGLWVGTAGGLARIDGSTSRFVDETSGLPSDLVRALHIDRRGMLWVGTENGGLARLDPTQVASSDQPPDVMIYDRSDGLLSNGIHHILEDDLGFLWMSSNQGIFRVSLADLEALARQETSQVESVDFTERDGMRSREANGGCRNAGLLSRDGRLWFATQAGVAVIDPRHPDLQVNEPIEVRLEQLEVGAEERRLPEAGTWLEANERTFSIRYTGSSLRAAENTRFRYRLLGYDEAWVDAGSRREAFFTRVPAGRYVFEVEARIAGQGWQGESARTTLTIAPFLRETLGFRVFSILCVGLFGFGVLRVQAYRQRAQRRRLEALVEERTATIATQAEKLRELDRLKSDLFTNVSHEFRTPLTLTIGPLQDLLEGARGPLSRGAKKDVALALRNSRRVLDLINQILDVARLEAGHLRLRVVEMDLVPWLSSRLEAFRPLAERNRIHAVLDPLPEESWVFADPEQLAKVVDNLLANAFNMTPDDGTIRLAVSDSPSNGVRILVEDSGPGIAAETLPQIFDRFHQAEKSPANEDSSSHRRWPGTGIGLALAKEIVDLHGGALSAESILGQGATFIVELRKGKGHFAPEALVDESSVRIERTDFQFRDEESPGADTDDESTVGLSVDASEADESEDRATVLVVDDEPEVRAYVQRRLRGDFRVLEAEDGVAALHRARAQVPDLIVSDVMMPNLDGYGLARALKADPELSFVPIILLTAKTSTESKLAGLGEGIDDYLSKPFDGRELIARVHNLIEGRRRLVERFEVENGGFGLRLPSAELQPADQAFLDRARDLIAEHMGDSDFGVEVLASKLGCDRTYLFRRFRELLDESPSAVIRELRLARAGEMLAARVGSVAEIAYAVGFKSVSHFSQRFRQRFDATPSAFAAEHSATDSE